MQIGRMLGPTTAGSIAQPTVRSPKITAPKLTDREQDRKDFLADREHAEKREDTHLQRVARELQKLGIDPRKVLGGGGNPGSATATIQQRQAESEEERGLLDEIMSMLMPAVMIALILKGKPPR